MAGLSTPVCVRLACGHGHLLWRHGEEAGPLSPPSTWGRGSSTQALEPAGLAQTLAKPYRPRMTQAGPAP